MGNMNRRFLQKAISLVLYTFIISAFVYKIRYCAVKKYKTYFDSIYGQKNIRKKACNNILITTVGQSGSTLMGEIFQSHSMVTYFYEPLTPLYHDWMKKRYHKSKLLQSEIDVLDKCYNQCKQKDDVVVIKYLHERVLNNLNSLSTLLKHQKLKFIHLVRDPRAVLKSIQKENFAMLKYHQYDSDSEKIAEFCSLTLNELRFGKKYLNDQYMLVRYEDMVTNIDKYSNLLLEFVGLPDDGSFREYVMKLQLTSQPKNINRFDTKTNLTTPLNNWRHTLDLEIVDVIEQKCGDMMQELGYKFISGDINKLRKFNISLF